jgi:hypothetical protein
LAEVASYQPDVDFFWTRVTINRASSDILLAHILTYLNENDYILRTSFFEHMADIYAEIGPVSVEEYILPMMMQALAGEKIHPPMLKDTQVGASWAGLHSQLSNMLV